ncbi:hypothetical protein DV737_g1882, partial [Chaetothyriales sp. CBS 132003]
MKLIVAGSTGLIGKEVVRQALADPAVSSVVALARREDNYEAAPGGDKSKLVLAIVENFGLYDDEVKEKLADADAVIWTVAITPAKSVGQDAAEVKRVCDDYTFLGLDAITSARQTKTTTPLRFLYLSGMAVSRDTSAIPDWVPKEMLPYLHMRCDVVNRLVAQAEKTPEQISLLEVRPGLITYAGRVLDERTKGYPQISVQQLSAALLHQVINGYEKDPLLNDDLEEEIMNGAEIVVDGSNDEEIMNGAEIVVDDNNDDDQEVMVGGINAHSHHYTDIYYDIDFSITYSLTYSVPVLWFWSPKLKTIEQVHGMVADHLDEALRSVGIMGGISQAVSLPTLAPTLLFFCVRCWARSADR